MKVRNTNIIDLYKKFYDFEKKNDLLDFSINDIKVWQLIRFTIFSDLKIKLFKSGQAHTQKNKFLDKIRFLPGIIYNSLTKNPLYGNYNKEILIFDHARKVKVNNNYIDIYTNDFINQLEAKSYQVIEFPYQWKHYTERKNDNIKYSDAIILNTYIRKTVDSLKNQKKDLHSLIEIQEKINIDFDVNINIINKSKKAMDKFEYEYNYYIKLLQKRKPKLIYLVVSYGHPALIAAAKALKIEVVEFQHGVITPYHVAYNYPNATHEIEYFPNKLLTFGEYWNKSAAFPNDVKIETYGYPYLTDRRDLYQHKEENKNKILFLSQGTIGKELSELAYKVAGLLPNYKIIYKLHPGEHGRWKAIYPDLIRANQLNNFEVIDHSEKELYYYFAQSEFQVGVYSTALFEGLTFDCKTILFNLPGVEYMEDLVQKNIVKKVNNADEFLRYMKEFKIKKFDRSYFFQ